MISKKMDIQNQCALVQPELLQVGRDISEQLQSPDAQISAVLQSLAEKPGKMIRPALVLLCGKLFGPILRPHRDFSVTVELIHMASLLHDDVIDKAQLRRGRRSANALWGNTAAVLLGDFLLSRAFVLAADSKYEGAATVLGQTAQKLCVGELKQNLFKGCFDLNEQDYFQMIEAKTAALFCCSCQLGAMASEASEVQQEILGEFGRRIGLAFQIADDLRDVLSSEQQAGKTLGTDLLQGKFTLPVIHWIGRGDGSEQSRSEQTAILKEPKRMTEQMRLSGSIDYALDQAQMQVEQAKQALDGFPATDAKNALLGIAEAILADIS